MVSAVRDFPAGCGPAAAARLPKEAEQEPSIPAPKSCPGFFVGWKRSRASAVRTFPPACGRSGGSRASPVRTFPLACGRSGGSESEENSAVLHRNRPLDGQQSIKAKAKEKNVQLKKGSAVNESSEKTKKDTKGLKRRIAGELAKEGVDVARKSGGEEAGNRVIVQGLMAAQCCPWRSRAIRTQARLMTKTKKEETM